MSGLKIAIGYGVFPQKLGFCGPQEKYASQDLLNYLLGKRISEERIRKIMKKFKGAYSYYKLIAKSNKIKDSFDERVVEAYWIGNNLLDRVKFSDLRKMIIDDFSAPGLLKQEEAERRAKNIPLNSRPHHSFHVLVIGSVSGRVDLKGKLLDLCRIGWGRVQELKKHKVIIDYYPLSNKRPFYIGKPIKKEFSWNKDLIPKIKKRDWVTTHWNNLIQVINKENLNNLKKYTQITLNSFNE